MPQKLNPFYLSAADNLNPSCLNRTGKCHFEAGVCVRKGKGKQDPLIKIIKKVDHKQPRRRVKANAACKAAGQLVRFRTKYR